MDPNNPEPSTSNVQMETETRPIHIFASSDRSDPEVVRAVKDGIQEVLDKFKDTQAVVYVTIENLHVHTGGKRKHSRSRSRGKRDRSRSRSGHRRGRHGFGHHGHHAHHGFGHHGFGHGHHGFGHGHGHHGHAFGPEGRHGFRPPFFWDAPPFCLDTSSSSSSEESSAEQSQQETTTRKDRKRSRSRSRSATRKCGKKYMKWLSKQQKKAAKRQAKDKKGDKGNSSNNWEVVDLTNEQQKQGQGDAVVQQVAQGEVPIQEQFDNMHVKSP